MQRRNRLCLTKAKKEIVRKGRKCKNTQKNITRWMLSTF